MSIENWYCRRCFLTHGTFAYAYFINQRGECQEMNEISKENSKDLVNDIKRKI